VGQKTHPTGFRLGTNKAYSTVWFSKYSSFSSTLEEDYRIRKFCEKELELFYNKVGIAKLEIRRKIGQIELLIYAARPKEIAQEVSKTNLLVKLKDSLKLLINNSSQICIRVIQVAMGEKESALVARFIATRLEKRIVFRRVIRKVEEILGRRKVKGFKLQLSGRLNGAEIARVAWTREGRVPLQTLGADISYATYRAHTIYGIIGIKVWIFLGEI